MCEVQLGYAIGVAEPVSFRIDTFGTAHVKIGDIYEAVLKAVDMRPMGIITRFGMTAPMFSRVACRTLWKQCIWNALGADESAAYKLRGFI